MAAGTAGSKTVGAAGGKTVGATGAKTGGTVGGNIIGAAGGKTVATAGGKTYLQKVYRDEPSCELVYRKLVDSSETGIERVVIERAHPSRLSPSCGTGSTVSGGG